MTRLRVFGAAIVNVRARTCLRHLRLAFARDRMPAMGTGHQLATVGEFMAVVVLATKQDLHPLPGRPVDDRIVLTGMPLLLMPDFADIGTVPKDGVNRASRKLRLRSA